MFILASVSPTSKKLYILLGSEDSVCVTSCVVEQYICDQLCGGGGIHVPFNILTFTLYGNRGLEMGQECRNYNFSLNESLM